MYMYIYCRWIDLSFACFQMSEKSCIALIGISIMAGTRFF